MMTVMTTLAGRWRIVDATAWPPEHLDLCGPAFLRIAADGTGEMAFGALTAAVNAGYTASGIDFDSTGTVAKKATRSRKPAGPTCTMTATSTARSSMTMATTQPSSPYRGLF